MTKVITLKKQYLMRQLLSFLVLAMVFATACNNELTSERVLEKTINYHDPDGKWNSFNGSFVVTMETPNRSDRVSDIRLNLVEGYFELNATRDSVTTTYKVQQDTCVFALNNNYNISDSIAKTHNLSRERGFMYKNYYSYLYGLPMKLRDPGTIIDEKVVTKIFKGKEYLVLKATYEEEVGTDIWYFYFDPVTYAMEIYQFFRYDESGNQNNDSGEYILLSGEELVNGIKMPKTRAWYYNKDDTYLGTDILN